MAASLQWQISFPGLDQQIVKLQQMKVLIDSISRGISGMNAAGGRLGMVPGGMGGGTVILPSGTTGHGGGAVSGAAAGAIAGGGAGGAVRDTLRELSRERKAVQVAYRDRWSIGDESQEWVLKPEISNARAKFIRSKMKYTGTPGYSSPIGPGMAFGAANRQYGGGGIGYKSPIGPGLLHGEKWAGLKASLMSDAGGGMGGITGGWKTAMGGGGFGGLGSALSGGFMKLIPLLGILYTAFNLLRKAAQLLAEGIKNGAEAYQKAARHANTVGASFQLKSAFAAIGLGGGEEDAMTAMGQFNPKARKTALSGGEVIGAMRAAQFANIQQLTNMSEEFEAAMKDAEANARQMEASSKATMIMSMDMSAISREWHTLLTQVAADMYPILHGMFDDAKKLLQIFNYLEEITIRIKQMLHMIPAGEPGQERTAGMGNRAGMPTSAWEKMGFNFPGAKSDPLNQISKNTAATTQKLGEAVGWLKFIAKGSPTGTLLNLMPLPNNP